jgi:hypothetical protein
MNATEKATENLKQTLEEISGGLLIGMEARYAAAISEITKRQELRQSAQTAHLATTGILTWAFGEFASKAEGGNQVRFLLQIVCALVVPLLGVAFASLMAYHDYIMGLLSAFCGVLEEQGLVQEEKKIPGLIGFHSTSQPWMSVARNVRPQMNRAFYLLLIVPSIIAIALTCVTFWGQHRPAMTFTVVTQLLIVAWSIAIAMRSSERRSEMRNWGYDVQEATFGSQLKKRNKPTAAPKEVQWTEQFENYLGFAWPFAKLTAKGTAQNKATASPAQSQD